MGDANAEIEELFQDKKRVRNPLVPIGALMTAGVLTAGLISFRRGNSRLGQKLMRAYYRSRCYRYVNGWHGLLLRGKFLSRRC